MVMSTYRILLLLLATQLPDICVYGRHGKKLDRVLVFDVLSDTPLAVLAVRTPFEW